jgi:hypothetical protein
MELYLLWIPLFLSALSGLIALISSRIQLAANQRRLVFVEREVFLLRVREERREQKLQEVYGALPSLKKDIDGLLHGLQEKVDLLLLHSNSDRGSLN